MAFEGTSDKPRKLSYGLGNVRHVKENSKKGSFMSDTLPPLNALRAFVVAGRHESFLLAGKELNVSAGAISRHVKTLEFHLNTTLFERQSNGVRLTSRGQAYLEKTEPLLSDLAQVTQAFRTPQQDEVLVISTLPVFAEKWLNPRLPEFQKLHPHIRLQLDFHDGVDTIYPKKADVMIAYTDQPPRNMQATWLFDETLVPVCSPGLRKQLPVMPSVTDILQCPRLQDTFWSDDWLIWAKAMGQDVLPAASGMSFALYNGVIQSAKSGMGIGIGHTAMIKTELTTLELFALEDYSIPAPASYYLISANMGLKNNNLRAFKQWMQVQAKHENQFSKI